MAGTLSVENSSQTPLGIGEEFVGDWRYDEKSGDMLVNVITDQVGTLYIEFGVLRTQTNTLGPLNSANVIRTLTSSTTVPAATFTDGQPDEGQNGFFRVLRKGHHRAFRVRYVNGGTAQENFILHTEVGENLFPPSTSDDNELLVTVTERERGVFAAVQAANVTTDTYLGFIDLSNTSSLPHDRSGRIDLTAVYLGVDRDSNATGSVRIGVITRIDGTDSDIDYVQGVTFEKSDDRFIPRDRVFSPNQLKCEVVDGSLTRIASQFTETGVTVINTGSTLTDANGNTFTPGVGDLVIKCARGAGSYNASSSAFYHGER